MIDDGRDNERRIVKGASAAIAKIAPLGPSVTVELDALASQGYRVLAAAAGPRQQLSLLELVALSDPPRLDLKELLTELRTIGVDIVMVTDDAAPTAETSPRQSGWRGGSVHLGRYRTAPIPEILPFMPASFPKTNFNGAHIPSALRGDGPMMRPPCARRRWASPFPRRRMSPSRRHPHLQAECSHQEIPACPVFGRRSPHYGPRHTDANAYGSAADYRGFHHDVFDDGPGDTVAEARRLANPYDHRRGGHSGLVRVGFCCRQIAAGKYASWVSMLESCGPLLSSHSSLRARRRSMSSATASACGIPGPGAGYRCLPCSILASPPRWRLPGLLMAPLSVLTVAAVLAGSIAFSLVLDAVKHVAFTRLKIL